MGLRRRERRRLLQQQGRAGGLPHLLDCRRGLPPEGDDLSERGGPHRAVEFHQRPLLHDLQGGGADLHRRATGLSAGGRQDQGGHLPVLHGPHCGHQGIYRTLSLQAGQQEAGVELHPLGPAAPLEPGLLHPHHRPQRPRHHRAKPQAVPGPDRHPDHDHHAAGLQEPRLPEQDWPPPLLRGHRGHAGGCHRAADALLLGLFLGFGGTGRGESCRHSPHPQSLFLGCRNNVFRL